MSAAGALKIAAMLALSHGGNVHERTLVTWPEHTPCMTVVDRSQGSVLHFDYIIPFEDAMPSPPPAEVADSRRHQFVAFCRGHSPLQPLPTWLSWADVAAAGALELSPADLVDADVLETSGEWAPCFHRITPDDARRPITFAAAAEGVDWDTSLLPAGPYVVEGYTWEPTFNAWRTRPGVVHVVDGPGLDVPPAAALMAVPDVGFVDQPVPLAGCARAMPGSRLRVWWALAEGVPELDWQPAPTDAPLTGETFALTFTPPAAARGQMIALRVDVVDPQQRMFSAHPSLLLAVLPSPEPCARSFGCDDPGATTGADPETGEVPSEEPATTDGPSPGSTSTSGSSTDESPSEDSGLGPRGCSCEIDAAPGAAFGLLALVGLVSRRRRA